MSEDTGKPGVDPLDRFPDMKSAERVQFTSSRISGWPCIVVLSPYLSDMSEKAAPAVDLSGVKPSTPPAARPRPPATPSYIFNPLNFVVISGLFYLVFQSLDYEPIVQHIYRQGRSLLGLPPDASAEDGGSRLYAVCTQGGNYIYTSEEGGEFQCILVNDGLIVGMGYQCEACN
jgi:hypothetical protein